MALVRLITNVATGKTDPSAIYARIKNGSVYKLLADVDPRAVPSVIAKIEAAGKIRIGGTVDGILWDTVPVTLQSANYTADYPVDSPAWAESAAVDDQPASVITWAESAAIDDGPAPCLSIGDPANAFPPSSSDAWKHTITPTRPIGDPAHPFANSGWLAGSSEAPRFRYFAQFKAKCEELAAEGNLGALQDLYDAKERKAHALRTQFEVFQKTMHDTESDWVELDRIQRVMEVVEDERDYASAAAHSAWEANS